MSSRSFLAKLDNYSSTQTNIPLASRVPNIFFRFCPISLFTFCDPPKECHIINALILAPQLLGSPFKVCFNISKNTVHLCFSQWGPCAITKWYLDFNREAVVAFHPTVPGTELGWVAIRFRVNNDVFAHVQARVIDAKIAVRYMM